MRLASIRLSSFALALLGAGSPLAVVAGCGDEPAAPYDPPSISLGDAGYVDAPVPDGAQQRLDGGFAAPDGGVLREDRFITSVVHFAPGPCSGFGAAGMPGVLEGPPVGAGVRAGSFDVVSLGVGGEIVVSFEPGAIADGPGADFIVFENAFYVGGDPSQPLADLGEVSVSDDGVTWATFACTPSAAAPYGACAGWHPVYSAPGNGVSPVDPAAAGGDAYDLSTLGVATARFVRIRDVGGASCEGPPSPNNLGFDLDAIAVVHPLAP